MKLVEVANVIPVNRSTKAIDINIFNSSFGLLHALELTNLHPDRIIIETRKEGEEYKSS